MFCVGRHQCFGQIYTADGAGPSYLILVITDQTRCSHNKAGIHRHIILPDTNLHIHTSQVEELYYSGTNMAANARVIRDSVISVIYEGGRLT
jgi:hypothetical protein